MLVVTWTINSDSSGSQQSIFQVSCVCTHKAILQFQFSVKYNNKKIWTSDGNIYTIYYIEKTAYSLSNVV